MKQGIVGMLWLGLLLLSAPASSQPLDVAVAQSRIALASFMSYQWASESGQAEGDWLALPDPDMNFGFEARTLVLSFALTNSSGGTLERFLVIENPTLDYLDIRLLHGSGREESFSLGAALPFGNRLVEARQFAVPLTVFPGEELRVQLRVRESGSMQVPVGLWSPKAWYRDTLQRQTALSAYFGLIVCLILYNLCLWLSSGMRAYSYYVLYIVSIGIVQASQTGFGAQYLWPNHPGFSYYAVSLFVNFSLLFAGLFSIQALGLTRQLRSWRLPATVVVLATLMLPAAFIVPESLHLRASVILGVLGSVIFLLVGLVELRQRTVTVRVYVLAWVFLFVGAGVYGAAKLGWLPLNAFTDHVFLIGSALEGVLLSFSLAARLREIGEKEQAMMALRMESALERVRLQGEAESARAANKSKSRFLATVGHEIRTPLNGILGASELLDDMPMPREQREYLDVVLHSGQVLLALVNNVLDYSRLEEGQLDVSLESVNLPWLLESTRSIFVSRYLSKTLTMETSLAPGLPEWIVADEIRVRQVLINLVGNAFKFTEQGGVSLRVSGERDWLRFEVQDTGQGIDPALQQQLFHSVVLPSTSSTSSTSSNSVSAERGAGLGMWICRQLVELMDGEIGLHSQPGQGTTVWFRIPLRPDAAPQAVQSEFTKDKTGAQLEGLRALVADDNGVNRMLMEQQLGYYGAQVSVAEEGESALALFREQPFDLVLLDYDMPGLNGCQVAEQMRDWEQQLGRPRTKIIGITAYALPEWLQAMVEAGMDLSLSKPVDRESLLRAVLGES